MKLSDAGLALLKQSEGFRAQVYNDIAGYPTIGYGHKLRPAESFPNGITEAQGAALLEGDVAFAENIVSRLVHVPLTQGQFDALVDFTFNLGGARLASSTLLKELNEGNYNTARSQILLWDHGVVDGKTEELAALKNRREAEFDLWGSVNP